MTGLIVKESCYRFVDIAVYLPFRNVGYFAYVDGFRGSFFHCGLTMTIYLLLFSAEEMFTTNLFVFVLSLVLKRVWLVL